MNFVIHITVNTLSKSEFNFHIHYFFHKQIYLYPDCRLHFQGQVVRSTWLCAIQLVKYSAKMVASASKVQVCHFRVTALQVCLIDDDQLTNYT